MEEMECVSPSPASSRFSPSTSVEPMAGGMDCYADDREALSDLAKYFNNAHLSDITLLVGDDCFPAHRLVLCRSSEVFDRWEVGLGGGLKNWANYKKSLSF